MFLLRMTMSICIVWGMVFYLTGNFELAVVLLLTANFSMLVIIERKIRL